MKKIRLSTVSQVYEAFLHSRKAHGAKEVILRTYRTSFLAVCKYADISELPMEELSHEVIDKMITKMVDAELSPNSINSYTDSMPVEKHNATSKANATLFNFIG